MANKTQHNKKALLEALEKHLGVVTSACEDVGLNRSTYYDYYKSDDDFRQAVDDLSNVALDFAESQLHKRIKDGDTTAMIFYLKTKGKRRGYIERIEQQHSGEINSEIVWEPQSREDLEYNRTRSSSGQQDQTSE